MPLGTHRQRVPAMLAVAVVGILVYSAAGAAPDDGTELGPAKSSTTTTSKCEPAKPGGGKDDDKETTSTTRRGDDEKETTSTTRRGDDDKETTSTTRRGDDDKRDDDPAAAKAAAPSEADLQGAAVATAAKDSGSDGKAAEPDSDRDCGATTTTRKNEGGGKGDDDGKGSTTTTTRRGGKGSTTTTTDKDDRDDRDDDGKGSTTSTTRQRGVEPHTPNPDGPGGSPDPGGSADPGETPVSPHEAPPAEGPNDPGPAAEPGTAADPGPVDESGSFDMWDDEEDYVALDPMEAPGSGSPLPVFTELVSTSSPGGTVADANRRERSRSTGSRSRGARRDTDDTQELAYSPEVVTSRPASPAEVTESESVRRRLGGTRASSVTESAFPGAVISTPADLPLNRRNPLAAAALVLLAGVSRELFKVWRRRTVDFWPA